MGRVASTQGSEVFDLSAMELQSIPEARVTHSRVLVLSDNPLGEAPWWINCMQHLRELHISQAMLTKLSSAITGLHSLVLLDASYNRLERIQQRVKKRYRASSHESAP